MAENVTAELNARSSEAMRVGGFPIATANFRYFSYVLSLLARYSIFFAIWQWLVVRNIG